MLTDWSDPWVIIRAESESTQRVVGRFLGTLQARKQGLSWADDAYVTKAAETAVSSVERLAALIKKQAAEAVELVSKHGRYR